MYKVLDILLPIKTIIFKDKKGCNQWSLEKYIYKTLD